MNAGRKPRNLLNIVRQSSIHGVMAVGMTFVILTAGIDLSVGSVLALTGVLCASFEHAGLPLVLIVVATLGIGVFIGSISGLIITKGKVTPFVVTLGMMSIARGALLIGIINNWMNLMTIPSYWQMVVKGSIIVGAALLDRLREK